MKSVKLNNTLIILGILVACLAVCPNAMAQEVDISDDELAQYATVATKIDSLKMSMKEKISEAVKSNELMEGGKLYNKLNKAGDDETKLAEIGATEDQLAAYASIQNDITAFKADFKAQYTTVVKEDIGAGLFNKVKKALKADAEVQARYDQILKSSEVEEDNTESEE